MEYRYLGRTGVRDWRRIFEPADSDRGYGIGQLHGIRNMVLHVAVQLIGNLIPRRRAWAPRGWGGRIYATRY